jgi:hypothetical protein
MYEVKLEKQPSPDDLYIGSGGICLGLDGGFSVFQTEGVIGFDGTRGLLSLIFSRLAGSLIIG